MIKLKKILETHIIKESSAAQVEDDIEDALTPEELEALKSGDLEESEVTEAIGITLMTVVAKILLTNAVLSIVSKYVKKLAEDREWDKVKDSAEKIYKFAHKNEAKMLKTIQLAIPKWIPQDIRDIISEIIYIIIIVVLGMDYATGAVKAVKFGSFVEGLIKSLKVTIKGIETNTLVKDVVKKVKT